MSGNKNRDSPVKGLNEALHEYFRVIIFDNDHWLVLNIKISLIFSEYSCSSHDNPDFIKMHDTELSFSSKLNFIAARFQFLIIES